MMVDICGGGFALESSGSMHHWRGWERERRILFIDPLKPILERLSFQLKVPQEVTKSGEEGIIVMDSLETA